MPDKCCVFNCRSNYDNGPKETVFFFPDEKKDYDLRQRWIRFVNREGWKPSKKSCICRKQFVIFKPLSYCFKETIRFEVKASFVSRP